jgi:hypothetical protein
MTETPTPREVIQLALDKTMGVICEGCYEADAILAALRASPVETRLALIRDLMPETHAVVPREPTEAMERASRMRQEIHWNDTGAITMWATARWTAMLAASQPQPDAEGRSDGE